MNENLNLSKLIQCHKEILGFNYDMTVDWAIELINSGIENENVCMLASFSKPTDSREIKPFVSAVLKELKLGEKEGKEATLSLINYHLTEIIQDKSIRDNLRSLYEICTDSNFGFGLMNFYLLYHGWNELDEMGVNFYYDGADKSNIEKIIKKEAINWIENYKTE